MQGPTEKQVLDAARKNRRPIPKTILEAPQLQQGLEFYMMAFKALTTCRSTGFDVGEIPWTAVNEYSLRYGLPDFELDILWTLIQEMDSEYLAFQREKTAKDRPKGAPPAAKPPRRGK